MLRDSVNNLKITQVLDPVVSTADKTSAVIDMQGYGSLAVIFNIGQCGDTLSGSLLWTLTLQESDASGSGYTTVAAADLVGGVASVVIDDAAEDETAVVFGYKGTKRYVKALATKTGSHSTGTPIGITAIRGRAEQLPVT